VLSPGEITPDLTRQASEEGGFHALQPSGMPTAAWPKPKAVSAQDAFAAALSHRHNSMQLDNVLKQMGNATAAE
jgi:hypothetical protein